jgi:GrpB-like predicted nucleotidyltransferase (UPF0157 family)
MRWAGSTINLCRLRVVPPVEIVEPSVHWPDEFTAIAHKLRTCLGPVALRIDHIGSTSVPGLPAKDVIDVQVTVDTLDLDVLAPGFSQAHYGHRSDIRLYDHRPRASRVRTKTGPSCCLRRCPTSALLTCTCDSLVGQISGTRCCFVTICGRIRPRQPRTRS